MCRCCCPWLATTLLLVGCSQGDNRQAAPVQSPAADSSGPRKVETAHLPNAIEVHPRVISGGQPDGRAGFAELQALGVKTIISVDGARPDVATAREFGLRYVHLPHGYDGISEKRVRQLAKAVRELDAPIYIHCHHGKHRSPAAASVACVTGGLLPRSAARAVLELAGTSRDYRGLYQSADEARPAAAAVLDELEVEFQSAIEVPPMAEAMVAIEHTHDRLGEIAQAGWQTPADHPDLEPAHEALLLGEHFTELLRTDEVAQHGEEFRDLLRDSAEAAGRLGRELRSWQAAADEAPPRLFQDLADRITANCKTCHQKFRDGPLGRK